MNKKMPNQFSYDHYKNKTKISFTGAKGFNIFLRDIYQITVQG